MLRLPTFEAWVRDPERSERYGVDPSMLAAWSAWHAQWQRQQRVHAEGPQRFEDLLAHVLSTLQWLHEAFPQMVAFCWSLLHLGRERVHRAAQGASAAAASSSEEVAQFQRLGEDAFSALMTLQQARVELQAHLEHHLPRLHQRVVTSLQGPPTSPEVQGAGVPLLWGGWGRDVAGLDRLVASWMRSRSVAGAHEVAQWPWLTHAPWEPDMLYAMYEQVSPRWSWPWNQHHRDVETAWKRQRQVMLVWALARFQLHATVSQGPSVASHAAWWTLGTCWLSVSSWWRAMRPALRWWHGGTRRLAKAWLDVLRSDVDTAGRVWAAHVLAEDAASSLDATTQAPKFWQACARWMQLAPQFKWAMRGELQAVLGRWLKVGMLRPMLDWVWKPKHREQARLHARKLQTWAEDPSVVSIVHADVNLASLWSDTLLLSRCCLDGWAGLSAPDHLSAWFGAWERAWSALGEGQAATMSVSQQAMACAYFWGANVADTSMTLVMPEREEGELLRMEGCAHPGHVVALLRAEDARHADAVHHPGAWPSSSEDWMGCTLLDATLARWGCRTLHRRLERAWHHGCREGSWSALAAWLTTLMRQPCRVGSRGHPRWTLGCQGSARWLHQTLSTDRI